MAIIYSYQENEELLNSDMLVGTATTLHNGQVRKITKNFTLGQLKTFISTGDLTLSNGGTSGPATLIDNILNIPVYQGQITLTTTGSSGAATLIGNTLNIPQYGGTPPTPTLQQVTTAGNTTSNSVIVSNGTGSLVTISNNGIFFQTSTSHGVIFSNSGFSLVDDLTTQQFSLDFDGLYLKTISGGSGGRIKADLLTSTQRTYQLPDASGTVALISDIPSAITLTTTGSSGSSTLVSGVLNVPTYTLAGLGGITLTSLSSTATGLTYTNTTGVFSLTAGYSIPATSSQTDWDTAYTNRITSLTTTGTGAATLIANVLNIPTPPTATFTSLTTTGSSGSSTLTAGVLNVPTYTLSGLGGVPTSRTLTINGTAYDLTADRSWSVGTVTSVTATSPITSSGGTTPVISTSMATNKLIGRSTAGTGVMEEITIGSGLTLTGGTLSSTSTSPLTTKGDIYTFSTVNARLGVGLDTQVLIADSTTATGLKWGSNTAATPTGYYAMYQDVLTQTIAVINTGYPIKFRTLDLSNGVTVVSNSRITFANTGIYNLQFSVQLENSDTQEHDVTIWLRKNGVDVVGSAGFVAVVSKHGGINGHVLPSWNYLLDVIAGEYYELVWSATSTQVTMPFIAAGSPPPSTASAIFTVTQQAGIMAGTGITAINSLTGAAQTLATNGSGTDFNIVSSGTTHTFNLPTASATNRGALSSADWSVFNSKGNGTVTSVAALTLGTSGTDLSSTVANGTTAPVITLNVPTASATNRGALSSTDWTTFNGKQNALLDIASVQDNGIYSTFMNGAISYYLASNGNTSFSPLRINSNFSSSGQGVYNSGNAIQYTTAATAGTLAWQRGVPFYHSGRTLMRFQPNIVSSDARYFVGLSYLYQLSNPTNVDPASLTQTIGVAKLSTSANLFIIHNDGSGVCTTFDLGVNYPANSNLYIYDIKITSTFAGVYTGVTVRRTTISTGAIISTDYVVPSNYPTGVGINPALWITNNATAAANSLLHYGAIGYNTTI